MEDFISEHVEKIIIVGIVGFLVLYVWAYMYRENNCVKWRYEKQFQPPMYMQPGKDGGISYPLSNGRWIDVKICDEFKSSQ